MAKSQSQDPVEKFVKKILPGATLLNSLAGTRNYQVPRKDVTLERVFEEFESNKEKLHITDWAITNTTLEEVFLRISNMEHEKANEEVDIPVKKDEKKKEVSSKESDSSSESSSKEESD